MPILARPTSQRAFASRLLIVVLSCGLVAVAGAQANASPTPTVWGLEQTLIGSTFQGAVFPIAADDAGNVFGIERTPTRVVEVPSGSATSTTLPFGTLGDDDGIAVDQHDDVFLADTTKGRVLELTRGASAPLTLPFANVSDPESIAVDAAGDVYVTDDNVNKVFELPAGSATDVVVPFTNLSSPLGVAVRSGAVYVGDSEHNQVVELPAGSTTQQIVSLGSLNQPSQVAVDDAGNLYVADTNKVIELAAGTSSPTTLVVRYPNSITANGNGDVFVTQGTGFEELAATNRVPVMLPAADVTTPSDVVADGAGDTFLIDQGRILELAAGATTPTVLSAAANPYAIAAQPAAQSWSNLYYFSITNDQMYELANGASTPSAITGFGTTDAISRLAVDAAGDLYGLDVATRQVLEVPAGSTTATVLPIGSLRQGGLALDNAGDLFVSDDWDNVVQELAKGASTATTLPFTGLGQPGDLTVDASGDVYVYDINANDFDELDVSGIQTAVPFISPGIASGLASDTAGDVFMTDTLHKTFSELSRVTAVAPKALPSTTSRPPDGEIGQALTSFTYQASGFPAPTFALTDGALPPGLTLDPKTGVLSGTPTTVGSYPFTVSASNVAGSAAYPSVTLQITQPITFTAANPPATVALGQPFSYQFVATGFPKLTYQIGDNELPTGLSINATTGLLSGTPTRNGIFFYTVIATDGVRQTGTNELKLTVTAPPTFTKDHPPTLAGIHTKVDYTFVAPGLPNPTFAVSSGALPPGLDLDPVSGEVTGYVTKAGSYSYAVTATNTYGKATTPALHFTVSTAPAFVAYQPTAGTVGHSYRFVMRASGFPHPRFKLVIGHLPPGLHLNAASGAITGTPTRAGRFAIGINATNVVTTATSTETIVIKKR